MSTICPECGERSNVVGHVTIDGLAPKSADDVIASRLACGHVVGGADYEALVAEVARIDLEKATRIMEVNKWARNMKTAAYKAHVERGNENGTE